METVCFLETSGNDYQVTRYHVSKEGKPPNTQHFIVQQMHTTLKNAELLKYFKIKEAAPTCFDLQGNQHQGATAST